MSIEVIAIILKFCSLSFGAQIPTERDMDQAMLYNEHCVTRILDCSKTDEVTKCLEIEDARPVPRGSKQ